MRHAYCSAQGLDQSVQSMANIDEIAQDSGPYEHPEASAKAVLPIHRDF